MTGVQTCALPIWWFTKSLQKGMDITRWINQVFDWLSGGIKFSRPAKKPKMKVNRGGKADDYDYNARKKQQSEEIDRILDKLKQSGYASLTTEEKKRLIAASLPADKFKSFLMINSLLISLTYFLYPTASLTASVNFLLDSAIRLPHDVTRAFNSHGLTK